MRLIDADKLPHYDGTALSAAEVARAVEAAPTIEATPVKHGRWEVVDEAEPRRYGCSICKCLSWFGIYNYCPNCGADMREGKE